MITERHTQENSHEDLGMEVPRTETSLERPGKDEDLSDTDEGPGGHTLTQRRCGASKVRRARRKAYQPYYRLSEAERIMREDREKLRVVKLMERMRAKGRAIAPYNTTQFIMADHAEDTTELLKLLERPNERKTDKASMDDEEEYYYSSPSDEEDFMSKEFIKDYNRQQVNNLEMMSKQMLLREYMIVLRKNETLESRLSIVQEKENEKNEELKRVEMLKNMKEELDSLRQENQKLVRSNSEIHEILSKSTSNFSEDDENKDDDQCTPLNDTGYESNQN
eukprot:TRINITY_DN7775_c0_g1_i1.p1 TRINITY_DN7775_c0_g1~~TRINITY_DN7775_c0_g1_i1.p1  ORF type:complete len:279 (-),score=75.52 TRINITY_DN7775_c0_g1_i1:106-942(-)